MRRIFVYICGGIALLAGPEVFANEGLKKGLAKAQYMLRQSNAEKAQIQKALEQQKTEANAVQQELDLTSSSLKKAEAKIARLQKNIALWEQEFEALKMKNRELRINLAKSVKANDFKVTQLELQTKNFGLCEAQNKKLVDLGHQLLGAYQNKTVGDALKQNDPFFGLKQVEIENLIQDYQHSIEDLDLEQTPYLLNEVEQVSLTGPKLN